jgi:drug/metabolite transporter (DMT)-like permease
MRPKELAALVALAAVWGGSFLFIRVAAPVLGPMPLVAGRVTFAALLLWLGLRARGDRPAIRAHFGRLLVLGALNAALPFTLIAFAELQLTASFAALLNATVPLWGALFGVLWLGERVTTRRAAGLLLGVVGVAVLVGWSPIDLSARTLLAIAATLVATASYASAGVYTKKRLAGVPGPTLALGQQVGAATWLCVPALWRLPQAQVTPAAALALAALVVLSTVFAYLLYFHLLASVGPTKVTTTAYLLPVFGMLWGALFLGEPLTRGMFAGLACILVSVLIVNDVRLGRARPGRYLTAVGQPSQIAQPPVASARLHAGEPAAR